MIGCYPAEVPGATARGPARTPRSGRRAALRRYSGPAIRSRTTSSGSGRPGSGASGSCDQLVPPDSWISGVCPVDSSTMVLIADSVPRHTYSRAAAATSWRRRPSGISGATATPTQPASHSTRSAGAVAGSRYAGRQSSVASTGASTSSSPSAQPLREAVVGVERGEGLAERMGRGQARHGPSHVTRTWCPYDRTSASWPMSRRGTGSPRRPVARSAGKSRTSSTVATPGTPARTADTSKACTGRPNGHPVRSGPPVSGER